MYRVEITEVAEADIQSQFDWWRLNRSPEQANRWYREIWTAIRSLRSSAKRCPTSKESELHPAGLRELSFGLGRRPTHRIVFAIEKQDTVRIFRIRHTSQRDLEAEDLP
jgi:plasmid stabilization system protein ParE